MRRPGVRIPLPPKPKGGGKIHITGLHYWMRYRERNPLTSSPESFRDCRAVTSAEADLFPLPDLRGELRLGRPPKFDGMRILFEQRGVTARSKAHVPEPKRSLNNPLTSGKKLRCARFLDVPRR